MEKMQCIMLIDYLPLNKYIVKEYVMQVISVNIGNTIEMISINPK